MLCSVMFIFNLSANPNKVRVLQMNEDNGDWIDGSLSNDCCINLNTPQYMWFWGSACFYGKSTSRTAIEDCELTCKAPGKEVNVPGGTSSVHVFFSCKNTFTNTWNVCSQLHLKDERLSKFGQYQKSTLSERWTFVGQIICKTNNLTRRWMNGSSPNRREIRAVWYASTQIPRKQVMAHKDRQLLGR